MTLGGGLVVNTAACVVTEVVDGVAPDPGGPPRWSACDVYPRAIGERHG
jgi:hypothetical protein